MVGINPRLSAQNLSLTKRAEAKPVDEQGTNTQEKAQVAKPDVKAPELNQPTVRLSLSNLQQMAGVKPVKVENKAQTCYELTLEEYRDLLGREDFHFKKGDSITVSINSECNLLIYIDDARQCSDGTWVYHTSQEMERA